MRTDIPSRLSVALSALLVLVPLPASSREETSENVPCVSHGQTQARIAQSRNDYRTYTKRLLATDKLSDTHTELPSPRSAMLLGHFSNLAKGSDDALRIAYLDFASEWRSHQSLSNFLAGNRGSGS